MNSYTGCAGGLLGRDPFSISDLPSGTLFLSLSDMPRHSPLSSQNWKPTSSLLPADLWLSFSCFHQTHDYNACIFAGGRGGMCVHMCVCGGGECLCVCVCVCVVGGMCAFWNKCAYLLLEAPWVLMRWGAINYPLLLLLLTKMEIPHLVLPAAQSYAAVWPDVHSYTWQKCRCGCPQLLPPHLRTHPHVPETPPPFPVYLQGKTHASQRFLSSSLVTNSRNVTLLMHLFVCLFISIPHLRLEGLLRSFNVGWEGSVCNHFPPLVHTVMHSSTCAHCHAYKCSFTCNSLFTYYYF